MYTNTALYTSDFLIIVLQTQQRSLDGAEAFWEYAQTFYDKYPTVDFDIAGVLPVLMKNDSGVDNQIIKDALESFGLEVSVSGISRVIFLREGSFLNCLTIITLLFVAEIRQ